MLRLPVIHGTRAIVARVPDDVLVLGAPPALDPIADVAAAAGQALRHPLSGPPLDELVRRGGRVTIVVEPPSLPIPGAPRDARQEAIAGVFDALAALGVQPRNHTLLVAAGLERRPRRGEVERLLRPGRARDFSGTVAVHDVEAEDLVTVDETPLGPLRVHRALVETDAVVVVSAAES
ncbi:MAG: DUF2088 domain-containing protein, partial [Actinobacteria bacterium]|nr:DUF2088 domain-containing protein [Actinomycetota bacterium]